MCCNEEKGKRIWCKAIFIPIAIVAGVFVFGWVVMHLWNAILPSVLGVGTVTFWQAVGILILSKILFGCFKGGHMHSKIHNWHGNHHKWMHMSQEERDKMKAEWKDRCCSGDKKE